MTKSAIDIRPIIRNGREGEKKERLRRELDELFWAAPEVYHELCAFCNTGVRSVSQRAFAQLKKRGLLERPDEIPSLTNEIVYEATHDEKPFWI